jgi:O-antigen ligase
MISKLFDIVKRYSADLFTIMLMIALPLSIWWTNVAVISLTVCVLYSYPLKVIAERIRSNWKLLLICSSTFLVTVLAMTYSNDPAASRYVLEKQLALLLLPFPLCVIVYQLQWWKLIRVFAGVIVLMAITCMCYAVYSYYTGNYDLSMVGNYNQSFQFELYSLFGENLMRPFGINPIYMSLYVSFAVFIILFDRQSPRWVRIVFTLVLLVYQALIGSRIGLLSFVITCIASAYFVTTSRRVRFASIGLTLAFVVVTATIIAINPVLKLRYIREVQAFRIPTDPHAWNSINIRFAIWTCSFNLFQSAPITGFGPGAQDAAREECLKTYSFYGVFGTNLNSHNQYFEYLLGGGLPLLLMYLVQLGFLARVAVREKKAMYFVFLILFIVIGMGESLLETNKGVVFFAFFNSFFLFRESKEYI